MYEVLKSFTTATRRFSPEVTPVIGPDDLAGCTMPIDHMMNKGFISVSKPASAPVGEVAASDASAEDMPAARGRKS